MKIYTKQGDLGQTSLWGGKKVSKHNLQVEAYGTVDELNACIGLLLAHPTVENGEEADRLYQIQRQLFSIGAMLAQDPERIRARNDFVLAGEAAVELENAIDQIEAVLEPLRHFILPGGCESAARAHLCRTVCRRAERTVVHLQSEIQIAPEILVYLNRLSDYFFVLARYLCKLEIAKEVIWTPESE